MRQPAYPRSPMGTPPPQARGGLSPDPQRTRGELPDALGPVRDRGPDARPSRAWRNDPRRPPRGPRARNAVADANRAGRPQAADRRLRVDPHGAILDRP